MSRWKVMSGDCVTRMRELRDDSVDSIVCDPPYGLEFMGKEWDKLGDKSHRHAGVDRSGMNVPRFGSYMPFASKKAIEKLKSHRHAMQEWHFAWAKEALRVLKPGGHLLAMGGTRTSHRLVCALEDAGFEIRDCLMWLYGSGFPKSMDVSKAIDKAAGVKPIDLGESPNWRESKRDREKFGSMEVRGKNAGRLTAPATDAARKWGGWGTALKPSYEPIVVARKPLGGTVARNVLQHGTGALNIDGCRVGSKGGSTQPSGMDRYNASLAEHGYRPSAYQQGKPEAPAPAGRWPANAILSHSPLCVRVGQRSNGHHSKERGKGGLGTSGHSGQRELRERAPGKETVALYACVPDCPVRILDGQSGTSTSQGGSRGADGQHGRLHPLGAQPEVKPGMGDTGGASRFFYCAKVSKKERSEGLDEAHKHPTVKPIALARYLIRLVTPPGGVVLDPFAGSGTFGVAGLREGVRVVLIEREREYREVAVQRLRHETDKVVRLGKRKA